MCNRVSLFTDLDEISEHFGFSENKARVKPHWNIAAGHFLPVVHLSPSYQSRRLDLIRWGLIPQSAKSAVIVRPHLSVWEIDGSVNEMLNRPARRCLVPVNNFYEWRLSDGQPFAVALASRQVMTLAGIWDIWTSPLGEQIACFALLTTDPNDVLSPLCRQMPVIIHSTDWNLWLGTETPPERIRDLLRPFSDDLLTVWAVNRRLRSTRNDDPELLTAI